MPRPQRGPLALGKTASASASAAGASAFPFNVFVFGTVSLAAVSWIIAFAGSIAASQSLDFFPKFTWWGLVFELFIVIFLPIIYFLNQIDHYRSFLVALLAIAFIYTSNSTNNLVYYSDSSSTAAGTGFILLSIVNFLWLFYLGSDPSSPLISYIDRFGGSASGHSTPPQKIHRSTYNHYQSQSTAHLNNSIDLDNDEDDNLDVHELAGFENPVSHSTDNITLNRQMDDLEMNDSAYRQSGFNGATNTITSVSASQYMESYPILVRGLYDYNANPEDVNELSFKKGDVFRVKNTNGNWWQGKNQNGDIGMCPSNYLEIVT